MIKKQRPNGKCKCGSDKKYKKCCSQLDAKITCNVCNIGIVRDGICNFCEDIESFKDINSMGVLHHITEEQTRLADKYGIKDFMKLYKLATGETFGNSAFYKACHKCKICGETVVYRMMNNICVKCS